MSFHPHRAHSAGARMSVVFVDVIEDSGQTGQYVSSPR